MPVFSFKFSNRNALNSMTSLSDLLNPIPENVVVGQSSQMGALPFHTNSSPLLNTSLDHAHSETLLLNKNKTSDSLFKGNNMASQTSIFMKNAQLGSSAKATLSMVHYKPNGIPTATKRKKDMNSSNELKVRMVMWDRVSDKATTPSNKKPYSRNLRACTLCRRKKIKVPALSSQKI